MAHQLLLADDSVTIQRVIKLTFADEDVEVVTVGDGNLAVAAIDKQAPDIVLADVAMPGRSGYDVAQHIRQTPALAHIPILLLTGAFEPVDEARASEVGCDGVLAKPFEPEQVVSRVKELLARPRPVAAAVAAPVAAPAPSVFPVAVNEVAPAPPAVAAPVTATSPSPIFPAPVPPPPAPTTPTAKPPADVDAYFERLDQAFATLALSPRPATPAMPEPEAAPAISPALADAFAGLSAAAPATPVAPFAPAAPAAAQAAPAVTSAAPALSWASASTAAPSTPSTSFASPATAVQSTPPVNTTGLTDAQIAQIVDRVVEALTVRLGVNLADVVSTVAERLVRDEINQIRKRV